MAGEGRKPRGNPRGGPRKDDLNYENSGCPVKCCHIPHKGECFSDPRVEVTLPARLERSRAAFEKRRKANAKRLKVQPKKLLAEGAAPASTAAAPGAVVVDGAGAFSHLGLSGHGGWVGMALPTDVSPEELASLTLEEICERYPAYLDELELPDEPDEEEESEDGAFDISIGSSTCAVAVASPAAQPTLPDGAAASPWSAGFASPQPFHLGSGVLASPIALSGGGGACSSPWPCLDKHALNLDDEHVVRQLDSLAARHDCVAVLASPPCRSFSAIQHNQVPGGAPPCRDLDEPDGFTRGGVLDARAAAGNRTVENSLRVIRAATAHGAAFIFEHPVSRAAHSPYAIPGREKHAAVWDTSFWETFAAQAGARYVEFDQCAIGGTHEPGPQKTTRLACDPQTYPFLQRHFGGKFCDDTNPA